MFISVIESIAISLTGNALYTSRLPRITESRRHSRQTHQRTSHIKKRIDPFENMASTHLKPIIIGIKNSGITLPSIDGSISLNPSLLVSDYAGVKDVMDTNKHMLVPIRDKLDRKSTLAINHTL